MDEKILDVKQQKIDELKAILPPHQVKYRGLK